MDNMSLILLFPQSQQPQYTFSLGLALGGLIGAILTGLINIFRDHYDNIRKIQNSRIKTYSQLIGRQRSRLQMYDAQFNAQIIGDYNDSLSIITALSRIDFNHVSDESELNTIFIQERVNSNFYKESKVERANSAKYMLLSAENSERFFASLGQIRVLFKDTDRMKNLIKDIENSLSKLSQLNAELYHEHSTLATTIMNSDIPSNMVRDELVSVWMKNANSKKTLDFDRYIALRMNIDSKIDELAKYLYHKIK
jgi:hypothetical protein